LIPVKQTIEGREGNCFSATLASLLHLPIETIPTFNESTWQADVNEFLRPFGLAFILLVYNEEMFKVHDLRGLYHEVGVESGVENLGHSCVGLDGEVVFDPAKLTRASYNVDTVGVFVLLKPWKFLEKKNGTR